jgi:hypothetical protein
MDQLVELTKFLAWPVVVLIIACSFRAQFEDLFKRSSGLNFEIAGVKFGLTLKEVHDVAQELFKEVSGGLSKLTQEQRKLFEAVRISNGSKTVDEITREIFDKKPFVRETYEHNQFRALREARLIGPRDGNEWRAGKYPEVTSYAEIILKAAPDILSTAKSSK